jgi:hypothetical protein
VDDPDLIVRQKPNLNVFDSFFQIEPLVDNPEVGENLQDHVTTLLGPFLINKPITFSLARLMVNPFKIWEYIINGTGPLTTTVAGDSIVFIKTNKTGIFKKSNPIDLFRELIIM